MGFNPAQTQQLATSLVGSSFNSGNPWPTLAFSASFNNFTADNINQNMTRYIGVSGTWADATGTDYLNTGNLGPLSQYMNGNYGWGNSGPLPTHAWNQSSTGTKDELSAWGYVGSFYGRYGSTINAPFNSYDYMVNQGPAGSDLIDTYGHGAVATGTLPINTDTQFRNAASLPVDGTCVVDVSTSTYSRSQGAMPVWYNVWITQGGTAGSGAVKFIMDKRPPVAGVNSVGYTRLSDYNFPKYWWSNLLSNQQYTWVMSKFMSPDGNITGGYPNATNNLSLNLSNDPWAFNMSNGSGPYGPSVVNNLVTYDNRGLPDFAGGIYDPRVRERAILEMSDEYYAVVQSTFVFIYSNKASLVPLQVLDFAPTFSRTHKRIAGAVYSGSVLYVLSEDGDLAKVDYTSVSGGTLTSLTSAPALGTGLRYSGLAMYGGNLWTVGSLYSLNQWQNAASASDASGGTASFATNVMTLESAPTTGSVALGQVVVGAGVPAGTVIMALASGLLNAVGSTYTLSTTVGTVATESFTTTTAVAGLYEYTVGAGTWGTTIDSTLTNVRTGARDLNCLIPVKTHANPPVDNGLCFLVETVAATTTNTPLTFHQLFTRANTAANPTTGAGQMITVPVPAKYLKQDGVTGAKVKFTWATGLTGGAASARLVWMNANTNSGTAPNGNGWSGYDTFNDTHVILGSENMTFSAASTFALDTAGSVSSDPLVTTLSRSYDYYVQIWIPLSATGWVTGGTPGFYSSWTSTNAMSATTVPSTGWGQNGTYLFDGIHYDATVPVYSPVCTSAAKPSYEYTLCHYVPATTTWSFDTGISLNALFGDKHSIHKVGNTSNSTVDPWLITPTRLLHSNGNLVVQASPAHDSLWVKVGTSAVTPLTVAASNTGANANYWMMMYRSRFEGGFLAYFPRNLSGVGLLNNMRVYDNEFNFGSDASGGTASFATNVMTLETAPTTGAVAVGQTVLGANVPANTVITALATGTLNAVGSTYTLSTSPGTITTQSFTTTDTPYTLNFTQANFVDGQGYQSTGANLGSPAQANCAWPVMWVDHCVPWVIPYNFYNDESSPVDHYRLSLAYVPRYYYWNSVTSAWSVTCDRAKAVAGAKVVPNNSTLISTIDGLVLSFGPEAGSTYTTNEFHTINACWGKVKYTRKAAYSGAFFAGQTFAHTETHLMADMNALSFNSFTRAPSLLEDTAGTPVAAGQWSVQAGNIAAWNKRNAGAWVIDTSTGVYPRVTYTFPSAVNFFDIYTTQWLCRGVTWEVSTDGTTWAAITPLWRSRNGAHWTFDRQTGIVAVRMTAKMPYNYSTTQFGIGGLTFYDYGTQAQVNSARLGSSVAADGDPARGSYDSTCLGVAPNALISIDGGTVFMNLPQCNDYVNNWYTGTAVPANTYKVHPYFGFILFEGAGANGVHSTKAGTNVSISYFWGKRV